MTGTLNETSFPARDRMNDRLVREVRYTGPASYVTGGDPIGANDIGFGDVFGVYGTLSNGSGGALRAVSWDYTNQKLIVWVPNTGAEVANAVDLSGFSGTLLFTGKG